MATVISLLSPRAAAATGKGSQGKRGGHRSKRTKDNEGTGTLGEGGSGLPSGWPQFTPFSRVGEASEGGVALEVTSDVSMSLPPAMPLKREKRTHEGDGRPR